MLIVAVVVAVAAVAVPAVAEAKMCANTYGGDVISAKRVKCKKARDVVRTWAVRYRRDGVVNRRVFRFRCLDRSNPVEGLTVHCRRPPRTGRWRGRMSSVRFYANVPR